MDNWRRETQLADKSKDLEKSYFKHKMMNLSKKIDSFCKKFYFAPFLLQSVEIRTLQSKDS